MTLCNVSVTGSLFKTNVIKFKTLKNIVNNICPMVISYPHPHVFGAKYYSYS